MTRGRKPTPTATKRLAGTLRKDRVNREEPVIEAGTPSPPEGIGAEARGQWDYYRADSTGLPSAYACRSGDACLLLHRSRPARNGRGGTCQTWPGGEIAVRLSNPKPVACDCQQGP